MRCFKKEACTMSRVFSWKFREFRATLCAYRTVSLKKLVLIFTFEHDLSVCQHGCLNVTICR